MDVAKNDAVCLVLVEGLRFCLLQLEIDLTYFLRSRLVLCWVALHLLLLVLALFVFIRTLKIV